MVASKFPSFLDLPCRAQQGTEAVFLARAAPMSAGHGAREQQTGRSQGACLQRCVSELAGAQGLGGSLALDVVGVVLVGQAAVGGLLAGRRGGHAVHGH